MNTKKQTIDAGSVETLVKGGPWLLTGLSGSGKDYVVDKFAKDLEFQALDDIASKIDGKWIVDLSRIDQTPKHTRVYGTSDNLVKVATTILGMYKQGVKLKVIIIRPTPELYRQAVRAKLADKNGDEHSSFAIKWAAKAKMSDSKLERYFDDWESNLLAKLPDVELFTLRNSLANGEVIERGWHGKSHQKRNSSNSGKEDSNA